MGTRVIQAYKAKCGKLVGSGTGAAAPKCLQISIPRPHHITRGGRISYTTRSCTLHDKDNGAYHAGADGKEGGGWPRGTRERARASQTVTPCANSSIRSLGVVWPSPRGIESSSLPSLGYARAADWSGRPQVIHPAAQTGIDLLDQPTHGLRVIASENQLEPAPQCRPILASRRTQRHHLPPTTADSTELKT